MLRDNLLHVENLIADWAHKLRINDWDIRYAHNFELEDKDSEIRILRHLKAAQIALDCDMPDDQVDLMIVHELLHLVLSEVYDVALEMADMEHFTHDNEERLCNLLAEILTNKHPRVWGKHAEELPAFAA